MKYGSTLDEQLIESRAQTLEAKQDLLTTELQLSDLTMQLNDVMGLPITTQLELDPSVPEVQETCHREECVTTALASHPEIVAARAEVEKASAGVRLAKADYYPDVSAIARYSYQTTSRFSRATLGLSERVSPTICSMVGNERLTWAKATLVSERRKKTWHE